MEIKERKVYLDDFKVELDKRTQMSSEYYN